MQATVSAKGQLVIPAPMRRRLRLKAHSKVEIEERPGGLFIRPSDATGSVTPPIKYAPPGSLKFAARHYALDKLAGPDVSPDDVFKKSAKPA